MRMQLQMQAATGMALPPHPHAEVEPRGGAGIKQQQLAFSVGLAPPACCRDHPFEVCTTASLSPSVVSVRVAIPIHARSIDRSRW